MKKILFLFLVFIAIFSFSININFTNDGFIESFEYNGVKDDFFKEHKFFITGEILENEKVEYKDNEVIKVDKTKNYELITTYLIKENTVFIKTKIKNISERAKFVKFTEILDYSDSFEVYSNANYPVKAFAIQSNNFAYGYFQLKNGDLNRVLLNGNRAFFYPKNAKLNANDEFVFERKIILDKTFSKIEKKLYDEFNIEYKTIKGKIDINKDNKKNIFIALEDYANYVKTIDRTDDFGNFELYATQYDKELYIDTFYKLYNTNKKLISENNILKIEDLKNDFVFPVYLTNQTKNGITINFRTKVPAISKVKINGKYYAQSNTPLEYHNIKINGLKENTKYEYEVIVEDTYTQNKIITDKEWFYTASSKDKFSFIVHGDTQIYDDIHSYVIKRWMSEYNPDFVIRPGDLVEKGESDQDWVGMMNTINQYAKNIPFFPALGNHEHNNIAYYKNFDVPYGGGDYSKRYYSYDWGNTHFIVLDSNIVEGSPLFKQQLNWLENDLKNSQDKEFRVAYFHHAFWAMAQDYGPMDENKEEGHYNTKYWLPLFKKYNLDVVFTGHIHAYTRYEKDGIQFITTGGGGAFLDYNHGAEPLPFMKIDVMNKHHYLYVEVENNKMTITVKGVAERLNERFPRDFKEIDEVIEIIEIEK